MTAHDLKITTPDGDFLAYLAVPEGAAKAPAILVIQEIFGVNANMRAIVQDYAAKGYIAIAPDLFWRQSPGIQLTDRSPEEWAKAFELYKGFDVAKGIADIQATITAVRAHAHANGKVGAVGFCLGGLLAYLTATRTDIDAAVGYYGVGIETHLAEASAIKAPVLLHIAGKDQYCPPPAQDAIATAFQGSPLVTVELYPERDHAFTRIGGDHYHGEDAALAHGRTLALFARALTA